MVLLCASPKRDVVPCPWATAVKLVGCSLPASQCLVQEQELLGWSAEVANLLSCFGQGPGQEPLHVAHGWSCTMYHYTVPLVTPGLFLFRAGSRNAPGYPLHQKGCANNCPVWVFHSLDNFSRKEKTFQRVCRNKLSTAISDAWRPLQCPFAIPVGRSERNFQQTAISHWQSQIHRRKRAGQDLHRKVSKRVKLSHQHKFKYHLVIQNICLH